MAVTPQMQIRLSDVDRAALRRIVERQGLDNEAAAIRWLIRQEDRKAAPTMPAPITSSSDGAEGFD